MNNPNNADMKKTMILTTIVCLIPLIVGAILYPQLPDQIATHWDTQGVANQWSDKFTGVIVYPGILLVINFIVPLIMMSDPKYNNMDEKLKTLVMWLIPIIDVFCAGSTLAYAMGSKVSVSLTGPLLLGAISVAVGSFLPKTKQSYTLGIKLPWTLNSENNWNATHRFAGPIWVICGIIIMISTFFDWKKNVIPAMFVVMIVGPTVYSYLMYRKEMKG